VPDLDGAGGERVALAVIGRPAAVHVHRQVLLGHHRRRDGCGRHRDIGERGDSGGEPAVGPQLPVQVGDLARRDAQRRGHRFEDPRRPLDAPLQRRFQPEGHRRAVGDLVQRAERVADGVGHPRAAAIDGRARQERGLLHGGASAQVPSVGDGLGEVIADETECGERGLRWSLPAALAGDGLEGVDEGVEPGHRRDRRRHGRRGLGVEHDQVGPELVVPRPHLAPVGVGQHTGPGDLRAGARRGRDGDDRPAAGHRMTAQDVVLDACRALEHDGHLLRSVDCGATTDADDQRSIERASGFGGGVDRRHARLTRRQDRHQHLHPGQRVLDPRAVAVGGHRHVDHQHDRTAAHLAPEAVEAGQRRAAPPDLRLPLGGRCHAC
jgi:hypothetical protein